MERDTLLSRFGFWTGQLDAQYRCHQTALMLGIPPGPAAWML